MRSEARRYRHAYDTLSARALAPGWRASEDELLLVHELVTGIGQYRSVGVKVGGFAIFPGPRAVRRAMAQVFEREPDVSEDPLLAALRLHVRVVSVHPFVDGNGRAARLLGSMSLMSAGYRSTLVTSLEEIYAVWGYLQALWDYWGGRTDEDVCVLTMLALFMRRSSGVAAVRLRQDWLTATCAELDIPSEQHDDVIRAIEFGEGVRTHAQRALRQRMTQAGVVPWHQLVRGWNDFDRACLSDQLTRIAAEEADARAAGEEQGASRGRLRVDAHTGNPNPAVLIQKGSPAS
jgi:prophage maintenance system killer protein